MPHPCLWFHFNSSFSHQFIVVSILSFFLTMALMQHHFIQRFSSTISYGASAAPFRFCSTISYWALKSYKNQTLPWEHIGMDRYKINPKVIQNWLKNLTLGPFCPPHPGVRPLYKIKTIHLAICPPVFHDDFIPFISGGYRVWFCKVDSLQKQRLKKTYVCFGGPIPMIL